MTNKDVRKLLALGVLIAWFMVGTNYMPWWLTMLLGFPLGAIIALLEKITDRWIGD